MSKEKKVFLTRDAILNADDIEKREVFIPEWNGHVIVRGMSGKERDAYEASIVKQRGKDTQVNMKNARAKLVALCTIDETGKRLFTEADVVALSQKSAKALDRIFAVAMELSGISQDDLEELTKNSEETTSEGLFLD